MTDSRPFLAYYRILKYLSPGSRQTSGSRQPDTGVQTQFMAWVQHWVNDEDFKQHVQPMWGMLSKIKSNWQHEAERDDTWDIKFVDMKEPLSKQWQSAGAIQNVSVQQIVAGFAAQPSQGQQSATALRATEMQPSNEGLAASALLQLPADQHFDEHGIHTGYGQEYVHEPVQPAGQELNDDLQAPWSTNSPCFLQQNAVPHRQDFMSGQSDAGPDQQGDMSGQQGSMPDQQGATLGQQGAVPGQQGVMPNQQGAMPDQQLMRFDADPGIIPAGQTATDTRGVPMSSIQVREAVAVYAPVDTYIYHCHTLYLVCIAEDSKHVHTDVPCIVVTLYILSAKCMSCATCTVLQWVVGCCAG